MNDNEKYDAIKAYAGLIAMMAALLFIHFKGA